MTQSLRWRERELSEDQIMTLLKEALMHADANKADLVESLSMEATFAQLGIESLTAMEMAGYIEEKLGVHFPDDELASIANIGGFVELIKKIASAAFEGA